MGEDKPCKDQIEQRLKATEERFRIAQVAGGIGWFEWDLGDRRVGMDIPRGHPVRFRPKNPATGMATMRPSSRSGSRARAMDIGAPGSQLRVQTESAPMKGRSESTYRYTVIDTIGGGASEIQKNIISVASSACRRTSERAVLHVRSVGHHADARGHHGARPLHGRAGGAARAVGSPTTA